MNTNMDWVRNLQDVDIDVLGKANGIRMNVELEEETLKRATISHHNAMLEIQKRAEMLESEVEKYWSPHEIDAAKRGKILRPNAGYPYEVDGIAPALPGYQPEPDKME